MTASKTTSSRRALPVAIAIAIVVATLVGAWLYLRHDRLNPMTEDAIFQADIMHVSPAVPGTLQDVRVREGDRVSAGDLLFQLEQDVYALRVRQTEAELALTEAALSTRKRQIRAETANSAIAEEQIARAQSNLALTEKTLQRLRPLAGKGYVTQQQLDTAVTAERDARVSLTQAQAQAEAARELIGELEAAEAAVEVARVSVDLARKALHDTQIRAPNDGLVVGLKVSAGEHMAPGQSLFTLINTERWYATAFFRETDLPAVRVGACATVFAMSEPDRAIQGKVSSIGWGISTEDMISIPRSLPFVQKSLNWVRVAQRFPVRILLDAPPPDLMRIGASATAVVRPGAKC